MANGATTAEAPGEAAEVSTSTALTTLPASPAPAPPEEEDDAYYQTRSRHGGGGWLRLLLPLAALGLVAGVFFLAGRGGERTPLPLVEGFSLEAGMEVTNPRFMGEAEDGSPFRVAAAKARPDSPDPTRIDLVEVDGELAMPGGRRLNAAAAEGVYQPKAQSLVLSGGVRAETDDGYRLTSDAIAFDLRTRAGRTETPVRIAGPLGQVSARRMEATVDGDLVVRFDGEVKVVIQALARPNADAEARAEAARAAGVAPAPAAPSGPAPTRPAE